MKLQLAFRQQTRTGRTMELGLVEYLNAILASRRHALATAIIADEDSVTSIQTRRGSAVSAGHPDINRPQGKEHLIDRFVNFFPLLPFDRV